MTRSNFSAQNLFGYSYICVRVTESEEFTVYTVTPYVMQVKFNII